MWLIILSEVSNGSYPYCPYAMCYREQGLMETHGCVQMERRSLEEEKGWQLKAWEMNSCFHYPD